LSPDQLTRLLRGMRDILPFVARPEVTIEWYPREADTEKLAAAQAAGCTRISLGAQSWDAAAAAAMGAHHSGDEIDTALSTIREIGFDNVNIDLMANTPGQSLETHLADIDRAVAWSPTMISLNALEVAHGTPLAARAQTTFEESDAGKRRWLRTAREKLFEHGFRHQRVRNLHRPGGLHRYNRVSTGVAFDILPVGPGGYGFVGGWAVMNAIALGDWVRAVEEGRSAVVGIAEPTDAEARRGYCVSSLLELQIDLDEYRAQFATDPREDFPFLDELVRLGAFASMGSMLRLTDAAVLFADDICTEFYSPVQHELFGRHLTIGRSKRANQYFPLPVPSHAGGSAAQIR
jgi:oxygen-independent coproporphyrinogen-3 oxidase